MAHGEVQSLTEPGQPAWTVLVPVKMLSIAKSRLDPHVGGFRRELALAMARDTVTAIASCEGVEVVVVTDDLDAAAALTDLATVLPDLPGAGINAALRHGAAAVGASRDRRLAAVQADLPSLRTAELGAALRAAALTEQAFVADAAGTGTTLYAASAAGRFSPRFGPGSAAAHRAVAQELRLDVPTLRRDVDTIDDLWAAARLGVGPCTAALLPELPAKSA